MNKRRLLLLRWTVVTVALTALVGVLVAWSSRPSRTAVSAVGGEEDGVTSVLARDVGDVRVPIRFEDVTERVGLRFHHFPVERASLLPEDMGSGVAIGDYDNDGFPDVYLVNFSGSAEPGATLDRSQGSARLYRNVAGQYFEDVTDHAGVGFVGYGMGAAWGDFDSDGDLDLYVTAWGDNVLYENVGGTFRDVTAQTGTNDPRFSAGCVWSDYDRDGNLDLYVTNYVDFRYESGQRGRTERQYATEQPYTLNPSAYEPQPNALFRNKGDGTFEDVSVAAGVADPTGRSLSASWAGFDNDGWPDLYVANDVSNNGVFRNRRDGTFEDIGAKSLAADYRGAMGIAVADVDDDLDLDLLITHWIAQENALYRNMLLDSRVGPSDGGRLWFLDAADEEGLGQSSLDMVGWATGFCDFDNDGRRDVWIVNGSTLEDAGDHRSLVPQRPLLFWNRPGHGYVDVAAQAADVLAIPMVGRGGAQVDFDRDGRVDLLFLTHGGAAVALRNVSDSVDHWLRVDLTQTNGNTAALGARVVVNAGGVARMSEVGAGSSYLSQSESTLHFGLGQQDRVDELTIIWPDGTEETHVDMTADQTIAFRHAARYPVQPLLAERTGAGVALTPNDSP